METPEDKKPIAPPAPPTYLRYFWPFYRELLRRSSFPIICGPFLGEVGFEVLYWIPWLQKLRADLKLDPARVIVIGRGGSALWYDVPVGVELYGMRSLQDIRIANWIQTQKTGYHKQYRMSASDRSILADAAASLNIKKYLTLHPSWMYQQLAPFWSAEKGLNWLQHQIHWGPMSAPTLEGLQVPERYAAVRFYFRPTFPANPTTVSFCQATIEKIAKAMPVLVITSGVHADDHADFLPKKTENVTLLSDIVPMTAENNLAIQSAVLAKATVCVGTYGGMTQYASKLGVPTYAFYDQWDYVCLAHRHVSEAMALSRNIPFTVLKLGDLPNMQAILPTAMLES